MAKTKYNPAMSESSNDQKPSKKPTKSHPVSRVVIEPASNGYIIKCEYEGKSGEPTTYMEPEKKVATDLAGVIAVLKKKLA